MDWAGDTPTNWYSQLALPTQDSSGVWYRKNDNYDHNIDNSTWIQLAEKSDITTLQSNFQAGVDSVYNAIVAQGTTPASKSLSDVVTGVGTMSTNRYNSGYSAGSSAGYSSGYNQGVTDADNRVNYYSASYSQGVTDADNRANPSSVNYQTGYNKGKADGKGDVSATLVSSGDVMYTITPTVAANSTYIISAYRPSAGKFDVTCNGQASIIAESLTHTSTYNYISGLLVIVFKTSSNVTGYKITTGINRSGQYVLYKIN